VQYNPVPLTPMHISRRRNRQEIASSLFHRFALHDHDFHRRSRKHENIFCSWRSACCTTHVEPV